MLIDLVIIKHPNTDRYFLFQAPFESGLKENDEVRCDTKYGTQPGTVVGVLEGIDDKARMLGFVTKLVGGKLPLKRVIGKYFDLDYDDNAMSLEKLYEGA